MPRKPTLKALTPPSVRHPDGLPRCQRLRRLPNGRRVQCKRPASWQLGARTCGVHGAGWPVRVLRGERQNPVVASLDIGRRASDLTIQIAMSDPALREQVSGVFAERAVLRLCQRAHARSVELKGQGRA